MGFQFKEQFGIAAPELGWVPAPTYILRRALILEAVTGLSPGSLIEVGCGSGALLCDLARLGFHGIGIEPSRQARHVASKLLVSHSDLFIILGDLSEASGRVFDYLFAFEVLEHIENDVAELRMWSDFVKPGGTLLLSVPARKSLWSSSDVWAGHYRRYERSELITKVSEAGFIVETLHSYGWPLSNFIEPIRSRMHSRKLKHEGAHHFNAGRVGRSLQSGIERSVEVRLYPLYSSIPGRLLFSFSIFLQRRALLSDRGTGYLLRARRR
jgi:2-polyprenyl-3-methyl-5-hydroxy-6-metoxy-1,4-benzoquinol methylase